jgi:hypothetical protein
MALDLQQEQLLTFAEASARFPGRPHLATLHRWRLRGIRGIQLESCLIGGRRFTSVEALQRFSNRLDPAASTGGPPHSKSANRRRRASADAICKQAGI